MKRFPVMMCILIFLLGCGGWLWAFYDVCRHWNVYHALQVSSTLAIFAFRWTLVILGIGVYGFGLMRRRRKLMTVIRRGRADWLAVRLAVYCLLPPFVVTSFLHFESLNLLEGNAFLMRSVFFSTVWSGLLIWSVWAFRYLRHPAPTGKRGRWWKPLDIICMNLILVLFFGETSLMLFNAVRPSMLFYTQSSNILNRMESLRWGRGASYFNFRMNSQEYHDEEFFQAADPDLVIGLLADSFGLGVVPYEYNFVTLAERTLQQRLDTTYNRIAVHNFGVPATAMSEYAFLLETEVLPTNPALVVVCLFIGNDVIESQHFGELPSSRYAFQNWFLWLLPKRLTILSQEKRRQAIRREEFDGVKIGRLTEDGEIPAYIEDSSLESPTLSVEKFREIEQWRFEVCNPRNPQWQKGFEGVFKGLRHFQSRLGDKLLVVLIPDEFQVNNDVYADILRANRHYASYSIEYPQQKILAFCREHELTCIDLLPALREGQQTARTYHLRDTHFNAYGNKIAGQELAEALYRHLTR